MCVTYLEYNNSLWILLTIFVRGFLIGVIFCGQFHQFLLRIPTFLWRIPTCQKRVSKNEWVGFDVCKTDEKKVLTFFFDSLAKTRSAFRFTGIRTHCFLGDCSALEPALGWSVYLPKHIHKVQYIRCGVTNRRKCDWVGKK